MPGEDGLSLARGLRQVGTVGIIILTASTDRVDRIVGLELAADDWMQKPFDPRELLARLRSLVRRLPGGSQGEPVGAVGREVRFGRCVLNLEARRLFDATGAEVTVTAMEFDLLKAFAERPNASSAGTSC